MASLFEGAKLFKNGGVEATADVLKGKKIVGLYFSAHWCGPCCAFTPLLKKFYEELAATGEFEIVFISLDSSEEALQAYLSEAHGSWYYLAHGDDLIQELKKKFELDGIPNLVIVKENGELIKQYADEDVEKYSPAEAFAEWKSL